MSSGYQVLVLGDLDGLESAFLPVGGTYVELGPLPLATGKFWGIGRIAPTPWLMMTTVNGIAIQTGLWPPAWQSMPIGRMPGRRPIVDIPSTRLFAASETGVFEVQLR